MINLLKELIDNKNIDGYIVPKNDEFFSEYSFPNRLRLISNFSGSAGLAIILKNKNLLFVDGRYTLQAHIECGSDFKIFEIPKIKPSDVIKKNNYFEEDGKDDFEFNQDIDFENETKSPGWIRYQKKLKR